MGISHDDYHLSHLMLLPSGLAWSKDSGALKQLSEALTKAYGRVSEADDALEKEIFPETSSYLLEEYEEAFGLPECDSLGEQTIARRRQAVYAKDTLPGDLSAWGLEALCASYGFDVEISVAYRHHCLRDCMYPLYPYDNQFYLIAKIKTDDLTVTCLLDKHVIAGWEVIYKFEEEE